MPVRDQRRPGRAWLSWPGHNWRNCLKEHVPCVCVRFNGYFSKRQGSCALPSSQRGVGILDLNTFVGKW